MLVLCSNVHNIALKVFNIVFLNALLEYLTSFMWLTCIIRTMDYLSLKVNFEDLLDYHYIHIEELIFKAAGENSKIFQYTLTVLLEGIGLF